MEVRIASRDDADELLALNELFGNATSLELLRESLLENDREVVCIAYCDGVAAGYCCGLIVTSMCYGERRADIEALYVKEEFRRQGIGEALLTCLDECLAARGIQHFHLTTHRDNATAQALYKKLGYVDSGEILMEKSKA